MLQAVIPSHYAQVVCSSIRRKMNGNIDAQRNNESAQPQRQMWQQTLLTRVQDLKLMRRSVELQ